MKQSIPIRISKKNYAELRRVASETRTTLSGLMNFVVELYLRDRRVNKQLSAQVEVSQSKEATV